MNHLSSGRDPDLDIARGIAMLLVLYGHAIEMFPGQRSEVMMPLFRQWQFIYGFHMPLFFVFSSRRWAAISRPTTFGSR